MSLDPSSISSPVERAKTAISRRELSRPIKLVMAEGFLRPTKSVFDFGCGRGDDIRLLREAGYSAAGWDPHFYPDEKQDVADVVNLGFVLNVIERLEERQAALKESWELAREVLVVAALVTADDRGKVTVPFADGVLTGIGTFQKYYTQGELKAFIEDTLGAEALAVSLGVFFVFRDEELRQEFLRSSIVRPAPAVRIKVSEFLYNEHKELLDKLANQVAELGRLPERDEADYYSELTAALGSAKKAFHIIRWTTGPERWKEVAERRKADTLLHLAVMRFGKRPPLSALPRRLRYDIRGFCGAYTRACEEADQELFSSGDLKRHEVSCKRSEVGKLMPRALYVHQSCLGYLPLNLRLMEACARKFVGLVDSGTVVKFYRREATLSYLTYPTFFEDAHPPLAGSIKIALGTLDVEMRDYSRSSNPPILHRKEAFVHSTHPEYEQFRGLTEAEEAAGLLGGSAIGNLVGWKALLAKKELVLEGHRLIPTC